MTTEFDRTVCLFDEEQHIYRINGRRAPGVTETLHAVRLLRDHSLTDPFYRERGTAVHKAIALDVLGRLDESTVDENVRPYLQRARGVLQTLDAVPLVVEKPMFDPILHYGGCLDILFLARVLSSLVLVDWKTGPLEDGHDIQIGAYDGLLDYAAETAQIPVEKSSLYSMRLCIVSLATENPKVRWIKSSERRANRDLFRAALSVYQRQIAQGVAA